MSTPKVLAIIGALLAFAWSATAMAQVPPGWEPEDVTKAIRLYLDSLPEEKMEVEGIVLEYKKIPGDPKDAFDQLPKEYQGADFNLFRKQIVTYLTSFLEEAGTIETKRAITLKVKKKRIEIPPGEYDFGIYLEEGVPTFVGIKGEGLEEPVKIPLGQAKQLKTLEVLTVQGSLKRMKLQMGIIYAGYAAKLPTLTVGKVVEEEEKEEEPEDS